MRTEIKKSIVLAMALLTGCESARYVDPKNGNGVVTVGDIDSQDWGTCANQMIGSLLQSPALKSTDGRRMVIMIGEVKNATLEYIDTDLLVKKIRIALNRNGGVITTTAMGIVGPEDPASAAVQGLRGSGQVDQASVPAQGQIIAPDYSLTGKIIQEDVRAGRIRQSTFSFQLTLTDVRTGLAPWEDEVEITKAGDRSRVSW